MLIPENSLKTLGVNLATDRLNLLTPEQKRQKLIDDWRSYKNEVLSDEPVSILYHYYPQPNGSFLDEQGIDADTGFDERERNGLPGLGFQNLKKLLVENPNQVILWYSPAGPASFDKDPNNPYSKIEFNYGQLYVLNYNGQKVDAVAIKVTNEYSLKEFSPEFTDIPNFENQMDKISQCLLNPINTKKSLEEFLDSQSFPYESSVYKDKNENWHRLSQLAPLIRDVFSGKEQYSSELVPNLDQLTQEITTSEQIRDFFLTAILKHQERTGEKTTSLSGSCGGSTINKSDIESILGMGKSAMETSNGLLSSNRRTMNSIMKDDPDDYFVCPKCGYTKNTRKDGGVGNCCPNCGITAEQALKEGIIREKCA